MGRKCAPQALQHFEWINRKQILRILLGPRWRHLSAEIDVDAILLVADSLDGDELHLVVEIRTQACRDHVVIAVGKYHLAGPGEARS
jgi:hypothetical protein